MSEFIRKGFVINLLFVLIISFMVMGCSSNGSDPMKYDKCDRYYGQGTDQYVWCLARPWSS